jgi:hypothetical protein
MRALTSAVLVAIALLPAAQAARADSPGAVSPYYLARADLRKCASPLCGGYWVRLVNRAATRCADGTLQPECYVAEADLTRLGGDGHEAQRDDDLGRGRLLVRAAVVRGRVEGFPQLGTLVIREGWLASSSERPPAGRFRLLRDSGVRCVMEPCFSIHATVLNNGAHVNVSSVDLRPSGAPAGERRRARAALMRSGVIAAGRIVDIPDEGPAGDGRRFVATQFFLRVAA